MRFPIAGLQGRPAHLDRTLCDTGLASGARPHGSGAGGYRLTRAGRLTRFTGAGLCGSWLDHGDAVPGFDAVHLRPQPLARGGCEIPALELPRQLADILHGRALDSLLLSHHFSLGLGACSGKLSLGILPLCDGFRGLSCRQSPPISNFE